MGRPKIHHVSLMEGFRLDVENLLARFIATENVRYDEFVGIWCDLNYPMVFCGIRSETSKRMFIEESFAMVTSYLLPPHDLQTRICTLYILYGLYSTQPLKVKLKIRMDPEHWEALRSLYRELKEQGHLDAAYIFLRMQTQKAFQFTATLRPVEYTRHRIEQEPFDNTRASKELMMTTFNPDLLEQLHTLHNHYQDMKQDLGLGDNLSMRLVRESMADYIIQRVHAHQPSDDDEDDSEQEPEVSAAQERAARIAQIKKKSFSTKGQGSSSQRHIGEAATSMEESETDREDPTYTPGGDAKRTGRKRAKRRGRKPGGDSSGLPSELEKKKAWSILPMRRLVDPQEDQEKDGDDEDSDADLSESTKKKKTKTKPLKNAKKKGKAESKKVKDKTRKKKKQKKGKIGKSDTETGWTTAGTSDDGTLRKRDTKGETSSAGARGELDDMAPITPTKRGGRKKKVPSSTTDSDHPSSIGKRKRKRDDSDQQDRGRGGAEGIRTEGEEGWLVEKKQRRESPRKRVQPDTASADQPDALPGLLEGANGSGMEESPQKRRKPGRPKKIPRTTSSLFDKDDSE